MCLRITGFINSPATEFSLSPRRPAKLAAIAVVSALTALWGCSASSPVNTVSNWGFQRSVEQGSTFEHLVLTRPGRGKRLHVYLEGDGRPWLSPGRIALDPTGTRLLMLELAKMDTAPVLYLGRPCYFQLQDARCSPAWWTFLRYAEPVVDSLAGVINRHAQGYDAVALFGHSGGGTLAMLLAQRLTPTAGIDVVATIAGNLDIRAWTDAHGYTPLHGSLNPAELSPLPASVRQYHLLGAEDGNVTAAMIAPLVAAQPVAELRVLPAYDHRCCWQQYWPQLLNELAATAPGAGQL